MQYVTMTVPVGDEAVKIITVFSRWQLWRILLNDLLQLLKWVLPSIIRKLSRCKLDLPKTHNAAVSYIMMYHIK